jgi:ABC-type lipoprotein release transport system permease subunit
VGGAIQLSVAVSDQPGIYNSYWAESGFSYQAPFTVVGITNTVLDKNWYVYVPKAAGVPVSPYPVGYTVGQVTLQNEKAAKFYAHIQPTLGDRYQLTLYDQGYSAVAAPYQTILQIAIIVTAVCLLLELAVVILFGFLFVYRQREANETMRMLGASRVQVCAYFLYSAGILSFVAAAAGAVTGYQLHSGVLALVARSAENYALIDSRFSNGNLTIARTLEFAPHLTLQFFLWIGAAVFLLVILSCLAFILASFRRPRPKRLKAIKPKSKYQTLHLNGGSLKFAILSMLRGGPRSTVVPILAVSMVFFFGQLSATSLSYQEQLEAIFSNTTIEGYYTDINGKQIGRQTLNAHDIALLYRSGQISTLSVSIGYPYAYLGIARRSNGQEMDIQPLVVPASPFGREALEAAILRGPDLTATNDIRTAPEFFYANSILMTFMDGYDESILATPSDDPRVFSCILPSSLMEQHGIELGDTVRVVINQIVQNPGGQANIFYHSDLLVVGSYEKQGAEDTIYAPLSIFFDTQLIWDAGQTTIDAPTKTIAQGYSLTPFQKDRLLSTVFHSASFKLSDSRALVPFKDYLTDYGYSQVQKVSRVREFIVLEDAAFNNATASVRQQIQYISTLYPILYVLAGIIALVVSYLLIASRKAEFATMRGLGSTRAGSFFSFFFEQSILCLLGTGVGLAIWFVWNPPTGLHLMLTSVFLCCYFVGCAVSITIMNQANVLAILLDKD